MCSSDLCATTDDAPVVAFRSGRGIVSNAHELGLTMAAAYKLWPTTDLMIAIGTRERESGEYTLKQLSNGKESTMPASRIAEHLFSHAS